MCVCALQQTEQGSDITEVGRWSKNVECIKGDKCLQNLLLVDLKERGSFRKVHCRVTKARHFSIS